MKQISPALQSHLNQDVTTLTSCWRITRRDGMVLGFTAHDHDLVIDALTYQAASGFVPSAIEGSAALNVDNLDIEGILDSESISAADLQAGLYDYAEISIFEVNYEDESMGTLGVRTGWLGEVRLHGQQFVAEMRGLAQALSQTIGARYSPTCRAELGDSACGVDLAARTISGALSGAESSTVVIADALLAPNQTFTHGLMRFTSGANVGIAIEVKAHQQGRITLTLPLPYAAQAGDMFELQEGCDKQFATCTERFGNAINFRGEPHVPGLDRMLETAATRG